MIPRIVKDDAGLYNPGELVATLNKLIDIINAVDSCCETCFYWKSSKTYTNEFDELMIYKQFPGHWGQCKIATRPSRTIQQPMHAFEAICSSEGIDGELMTESQHGCRAWVMRV